MDNNTTDSTHTVTLGAPAPAADASHPDHPSHPRWQVLLQILQIVSAIAPVAAAPFVPPALARIIASESAIALGVTTSLTQK